MGIAIFARLVQIQILEHKKYQQLALNQYHSLLKQRAPRGLIYDRTGIELALNKPSYEVAVDGRYLDDVERVAGKLAKHLSLSKATIKRKIKENPHFVLLERKLDQSKADKIEALKLKGVSVIESGERHYPYKETTAQAVGFLSVDGEGLSGIEFQFNQQLKGSDGWRILQKDALGKTLMPVDGSDKALRPGNNIHLTLDHIIQTIAEDELTHAIRQFNAVSGTVIVLNPNTGEILALASAPGFDSNEPVQFEPERWRIRGITDLFEPGSTFKFVAVAAALMDGVKSPEDIVFCENGRYKLYGEHINDTEKHGWLSVANVMKHSSNIGVAKIAMDVGKERLFGVARDFGFGNPTGVELPGESGGILRRPNEWSRFSTAAVAYGHEVAVTSLQIAAAYGAIANGGKLMRPTIIKRIETAGGQTLSDFKPTVIRRVLDTETAEILKEMLVSVVEDGTGLPAKIEGLKVAGKTGTAQKPLKERSGYSNQKYMASFAGFYPVDDPQFLVYINIDEPWPVHSGGSVGGPTFKRILQRVLKVYDGAKPQPTHPLVVEVQLAGQAIPPLAGRSAETAVKLLDGLGTPYRFEGQGNMVKRVEIQQAEDARQVSIIHLEDAGEESYRIMPDLRGESVRQAVARLNAQGLKAKIFGSGTVQSQDPQPGARIKQGANVMLECRARQLSLLGKA
jgi:cell division protein FtsI/penicillin-binding protein 2